MRELSTAIRLLHVPVALAMLCVLWIPLFAKKGSRLHVLTGRSWFIGMMFVGVSGGVMGFLRLLSPEEFLADGVPKQEVLAAGVFLNYLGIITTVPVVHAWRVVRTKRSPNRMRSAADLIIAILPLAGSAVILAAAASIDSSLRVPQIAMSPIGIGIGVLMVRHWRAPDRRPNTWLGEHLIFAGVGVIAALNAASVFISQALPFKLGGAVASLPWILPVLIGIPLIVRTKRRYAPSRR